MSLSNLHVENLLGGVTQRPQDKREKNQLELLDNGLPSIVRGLRKRPPTETVGVISTAQAGYDSAWTHPVNRTPTERYMVVVVNGDLKVFDTLTGEQHTVYFPDGKGYLANSADGFRGFTVGDHTFIVNRNRIVKRGATKSAPQVHEALLFVRQGDYATDYYVTLDGFPVAHSTPAEASPENRSQISTSYIAKILHSYLVANTDIANAFDLTLMGSTIHVKRKDGADFTAQVYDGLADKGLRLIKGSVQSLEDLPARARVGMVVEVAGEPGEPDDNSWVVYESGNDNDGIWRECAAPGVDLSIDPATMPHELVRQGLLVESVVKVDLPKQPVTANINGGSWARGWYADGSGNVLAWPNVYNGETSLKPNTQVRSDVLPGNDGAPKTITVAFSLDTSTCFPNESVYVSFAVDTGSGFIEVDSREYRTGGNFPNQTFAYQMTLNATTRVQLGLIVPAGVTDGSAYRNPKMTAHGTTRAGFPGILVQGKQATGIYVGTPGMLWPMGTLMEFTLNGVAFLRTVADDMTTAQVCADLASFVDAHAGFRATYATKNIIAPTLDWFEVQDNNNQPVTVTGLKATLDTSKRCWNQALNMSTNEYAGLTLRNLTTGATGTILYNSRTAFEVNALTGGTRNTFATGDTVLVEHAGEAYFVFQQAPWEGRSVGNDRLAPFPSFVDRTISEVFFHAGRLGFTAEDFVVLSSSDDVYRFFRSTVTQVLATDPIDVQSAHKDVAMLDSAIEWDGKLLLCSSSGHQFVLDGDPILTPETVSLEHMASFPVTSKVRPITVGATVVFPRQAAGYTQVRQMYRTRDRGLETTLLTTEVPTYIPGDTIDLCGDADQGFLALLPDGGARNEVYVFNYGNIDERTPQQAWSRWTFGGRVVGIDYYDGHLYLVIYRGSEVHLERINVADPSGLGDTHLDAGTVPYTFRARLSRPYLRDRFTSRQVTEGRTLVRTAEINHHDTGYLRIEVTPAGRSTKQYVVTTEEGSKRVPVLAENTKVTIDLVNDQPQGCAISGAAYEVTYTNRSYRP